MGSISLPISVATFLSYHHIDHIQSELGTVNG